MQIYRTFLNHGYQNYTIYQSSRKGLIELVNYSNIARDCQLPARTIQTYYEILEDTFIGVRLEPWRKSLRKRLSAHPRIYLFDNGVTNALNR
jgi:predicted AAA+ superfamily ATPase